MKQVWYGQRLRNAIVPRRPGDVGRRGAEGGSIHNSQSVFGEKQKLRLHTPKYTDAATTTADSTPVTAGANKALSTYLTNPFQDGITVTDSQGFSPYSVVVKTNEQPCVHICFSWSKRTTV